MLASSIILAVVVAFLTYIAKEYFYPSHPALLPPMPCRPFPFLGHLLMFVSQSPEVVFRKWKEKVGDVYSIYLGPKLHIIIAGYEPLKELFIKRPELLLERPELVSVKIMGDPHAGIRGLVGSDWRKQRAVTMTILKNFGLGKDVMAERVTEEVKALADVLSDTKGRPVDTMHLFHDAVSRVVFSVLVGERYDYDDPLFSEVVKKVRIQTSLLTKASLADIYGWFQYLPFVNSSAKQGRANTAFFRQFIRQYIKKYRDEADEEGRDNFIKAYLREMRKLKAEGKPCTLSEEELEANCVLLLIAGTDSTSSALLWFVVRCIHSPEIQEKIYEEIKAVVGTDRLPTLQDRKHMNYLLAFISEVQRITNSVIFPRICKKSIQLGQYTIPEGALVFTDLFSVFFDKKLWGDPEEFRPERFIMDNGICNVPEYQIPFFVGKRSCPGEPLAVVEMFLFICTVIQRFQILPESPDNLPDIKNGDFAPLPFRARFVERT